MVFLPDRRGLLDNGWLFVDPVELGASEYIVSEDVAFTGQNYENPGGSEPQFIHMVCTREGALQRRIHVTTYGLSGQRIFSFTHAWSESADNALKVFVNPSSTGTSLMLLIVRPGSTSTLLRYSLTGTLLGSHDLQVPSNARGGTLWDPSWAGGTQKTSGFGWTYFALVHTNGRDIILISLKDDGSLLTVKSVYYTYQGVMPTEKVGLSLALTAFARGVTIMWVDLHDTTPTTGAYARFAVFLNTGASGVDLPSNLGSLPAPTLPDQNDWEAVVAMCVDIDFTPGTTNRRGGSLPFIVSGYMNPSAALGIMKPVATIPLWNGVSPAPADYQYMYYSDGRFGYHEYVYEREAPDVGGIVHPPVGSAQLLPVDTSVFVHALRTFQGLVFGLVTAEEIDTGARPGVVPDYWPPLDSGGTDYPQPMVNPVVEILSGDVTGAIPAGFSFPDQGASVLPWGDQTGVLMTDPWRGRVYMWSRQNAPDQQHWVHAVRVFTPYYRQTVTIADDTTYVLFHPRPTSGPT